MPATTPLSRTARKSAGWGNDKEEPGDESQILILQAQRNLHLEFRDWLYEDFRSGHAGAFDSPHDFRRRNACCSIPSALTCIPLRRGFAPKKKGVFGKRLVRAPCSFSVGLGLLAHNNIHHFVTDMTSCASLNRYRRPTQFTLFPRQLEKMVQVRRDGAGKFSYKYSRCLGSVLYCEHLPEP